MALGILEPHTAAPVAGTVIIQDDVAADTPHSSRLKHGRGSSANVVLNPQPSDDPNDPLNWSGREKHAILAILAFGCIVTACVVVGSSSVQTSQCCLRYLFSDSVRH